MMITLRVASLLALLLIAHASAVSFLDWLGSKRGSSASSRLSSGSSIPLQQVSDQRANKYLQDFGYVAPNTMHGSKPPGRSRGNSKELLDSALDLFRKAIAKFQEFSHLPVTGVLDDATRKKMTEPRCGITDVAAVTSGGSAWAWRKERITYEIENYSSDLPRDDIDRAIADAYAMWSDVANIDIVRAQSGETADIKVRFGSGNHGDAWPFDGRGGVLAHATMPEDGALHFDDSENWVVEDARKIDSQQYTDLLAVAIHEAGHTLGLGHSQDEHSIMAPFYKKTTDNYGNYVRPGLGSVDVQAVQNIYGRRTRPPVSSDAGSSSSDDEEAETDSPDGEEAETDSPDGEEAETDSPDGEEAETDSPDGEEAETDSPDGEEAETDSPDGEEAETE